MCLWDGLFVGWLDRGFKGVWEDGVGMKRGKGGERGGEVVEGNWLVS